ncbi:4-hydroxy-3-methylbut-2-enyl diphosphate reductase [Patescibacteria group bacterium]|nr:4-hydroxy-3-methylbut-2-enyl diphosphate reductase [Patescibacteria group bacterium]
MQITISQHAGFCFGVDRAVKMCAEIDPDTPRPLQMFGNLVHNETVVENLKKQGIEIIKSLDEAKEGTVIITAHGIYPEVYQEVEKKGLHIIDTTCPKVILVHQLAKKLQAEGREIIIIGDENHIEVKGINGAVGWQAKVITSVDEVAELDFPADTKIGVVSQTTQDLEVFAEIEKALQEKFTDVKVFNTICESTRGHQEEAKKLAQNNDVILVIGSKSSGNTTRLYEICHELNKKTYWIDTAADLEDDWFAEVKSVGITAGASTPRELVEEVAEKLKEFC